MLKSSVANKLMVLVERHEELAGLLAAPEIVSDPAQYQKLAVEYAQLESLATQFKAYQRTAADLAATREMFLDADLDLRAMAQDDAGRLSKKLDILEHELQQCLLPHDPHDRHNVFLEIRAGTGGDEAALFAGDLFRMYARYAEWRGWKIEIISRNEGEHGGFKELIARITGQGVYSRLKFESGAHRVQRVPQTEAQGRIHTSAATVAVLPEVEAVEAVDLDTGDLRVDTYRASGAGGQHVNKTDSAVRITHLPTGIVVECQDERSQHKNRARALALLQARILDLERTRREAEQAANRKSLVGSGDRSERIRTYNFPQGRITDHRINLTLYKLEEVLNGQLDPVIDPLIQEHQAGQLAALEQTLA